MDLSRWTSGEREAPEPLEGNVVATVVGGTIIWFVLFLVQLPFYGWFADHDRTWWLWTCLTGGLLGLVGIWYVRRRDEAIRRARQQRAAGTPGTTGSGSTEGTEGTTDPDGTPLAD